MTLVRWNPFRDLNTMQRVMDRLFDESWNNTAATINAQALALDVHESADAYKVTTALPGVKAENIDIQYLDHTLTITAEISQPALPEGSQALMRERYFGKFSRSITLPHQVNSENISADVVDGVLTLTLPKTEEAKPRHIPVRGLLNGNRKN
jgi:HSP20 family protein